MKLKYSPLVGSRLEGPGLNPKALDAEFWRRDFPGMPWYFDPYTGTMRATADIKSDPTGLALVAPGEPRRAVGMHPALGAPYGNGSIPPHAEDRLLPAIAAAVAPVAAANAQVPRVLADDGKREDYPMYDGLLAYFPAALAEVARWSVVGNRKHNPGQPLHWAREKSTDHENKIVRHLLDARQVDKDGFVEAVALAWRALALCQTILEERGWAEGANARRGVQS